MDFISRTTPLAYRDLPAALALAEQAWSAATVQGPTVPSTLIAAAAAQWIVSDFADLAPLRLWAQRLTGGPAVGGDSGPDAVLVYRAGALAVQLFIAPGQPPSADEDLAAFRAALLPISAARDLNLIVSACEHAASWMTNHGQAAAFDALSAALETWLDDPSLDPLVRARWLFWLGTNQMYTDQRDAAEASWRRGRSVAAAAAWPWLAFHLRRVTLRPLLEDAQHAQAQAGIDELRQRIDFTRPLDVGDYHHLRGWLALAAGDSRLARQHYELACEAATRGGLPTEHMAIYHSGLALSLVSEGLEDQALDLIAQQAQPPTALGQAVRQATLALICACRDRRLGQASYRARLAEGLEGARRHGLLRFFRLAPALAARLCADALAAGIETEFVLRAIAERRLPPPPLCGPNWPWPVQVQALGGFSLRVGGASAELSRRKPLDLLRAIVARGPMPCDADALADALWPDAEGDTARTSLDTTLHRLRKVLGRSDCLLLQDGRVGLDRQAVWVDAWALADLVAAIDQALLGSPSAASLGAWGEALAALDQGDFLGVGPLPAWAVAAGERWRSQAERAARLLVQRLRELGDLAAAERLCRLSLERHPLAEPLHAELLRLLIDQGRQAEALLAFRRCQDLMAALAAGSPSPALLALAQAAGLGSAATGT